MSDIDKSGFPDKLKKLLPENFTDEIELKGTAEIKEEIIKAESLINETEKTMENDETLNSAKERVSDLKGGYTDVLKCQKAKIKYCFYLMNARGVA
jgi:hypothetical protein